MLNQRDKKIIDKIKLQARMLTEKWHVGIHLKGPRTADFGIMLEDETMVAACHDRDIASHIVTLHNELLGVK